MSRTVGRLYRECKTVGCANWTWYGKCQACDGSKICTTEGCGRKTMKAGTVCWLCRAGGRDCIKGCGKPAQGSSGICNSCRFGNASRICACGKSIGRPSNTKCWSCNRIAKQKQQKASRCDSCSREYRGKKCPCHRVCPCGKKVPPFRCRPNSERLCFACKPYDDSKRPKDRKNHYGYVLVKVPEHPCAQADGYVFEHRLVMERSIGRILTKTETVHHKNGIRDDNRLENLELWDKSHPAGQRVVDKISWAVAFLKRHGYKYVPRTPRPNKDAGETGFLF